MKKLLLTGTFTLLATGIIIALSTRKKDNINDLTLKNIEVLAFVGNGEHDITIPCKEQKKESCTERFYDADGNYVRSETFKNRVRSSN